MKPIDPESSNRVRLVIEPVRPAKFELDQLLSGITNENLHASTESGPPVGKEIW